jgi:hypothetical protein
VVGVEHGGEATAYPVPGERRPPVVNDVVGGLPVLVTPTDTGLAVYDRRLDGRALTFEADPPRAGGSRFDPAAGRPVDGPHEGRRLHPVPGATSMYWFAWRAFHPETEVYGR